MKLEKINSSLFATLKSSELKDLSLVTGGEKMPTAGYTGDKCENGKQQSYSDSRDGHMTKTGWVWDSEAYDRKNDPCKPVGQDPVFNENFISAAAEIEMIEMC